MRNPANYDLIGDRGVALDDVLKWLGADFTAATMRAQVRLSPDSPGSPLIGLTGGAGLTLSYGGTDTIANHVAANRLTADIVNSVNPATNAKFALTDSVALSIVALHVAAASMSSPTIPAASEVGDDVLLAWDLLIAPVGASEDKYFAGAVRVRGTVVQ